MDVVSLSPLRVASLAWQPRRGAWVLTVVCKATFKLLPGSSRLSESQEYPNDDDNHWNDDAGRSLYSPSDLCPYKQRVDVMLVGHAFAPRGEAATALVARLAVGALDKSVEVFGDRAFLPDGSLREPVRFTKMPLRYERAWAGPDLSNPVGMRVDTADAYGAVAVPNLQRRGDVATSPAAPLEPVGFGPIAPSWPERATKLGRRTHADGLLRQPLPEDLDPRYFNAAPRDQQLDALADDAMILLEHLHPDHPRLITSLPGIHPRAFVERPRSGPEELELACDTLWIDTDRSIATLTWRGQVAIDNPAAQGRVLVAMENPGENVTFAEVIELAEVELAEADDDEEGTLLVDARALDSATQTRIHVPAPRAADLGPPSSSPASTTAPHERAPTPTPPSAGPASGLRIEVPAASRGASAHGRASSFTATQDEARNVFAPQRAPESLHNALPFVPASAIEDPRTIIDQLPSDATPPWLRRAGHVVEPAAALPFAAPSKPPPALAAPTPTQGPVLLPPAPLPVIPATLAASPARPSSIPPPDPAPAIDPRSPSFALPIPPAPPAPVPAPKASITPEVVELLWVGPSALARVRADAELRAFVPGPRPPVEATDDPEAAAEARDRRDVFAALTRAPARDADGVAGAIGGAVDPDGEFVPPVIVVTGDLSLPFDEVATLKATVAAVSPLVAIDPALRELVGTASELLASPWIDGAGAIAEAYTARLRDAFARAPTGLPPTYLASGTERLLLEQRAFQRRTVLGERQLRGLITLAGGEVPVPVYLPELLAPRLPLFRTMHVRLLAEAHVQQDGAEAHPVALAVLALGRVLPVGRARR